MENKRETASGCVNFLEKKEQQKGTENKYKTYCISMISNYHEFQDVSLI